MSQTFSLSATYALSVHRGLACYRDFLNKPLLILGWSFDKYIRKRVFVMYERNVLKAQW